MRGVLCTSLEGFSPGELSLRLTHLNPASVSPQPSVILFILRAEVQNSEDVQEIQSKIETVTSPDKMWKIVSPVARHLPNHLTYIFLHTSVLRLFALAGKRTG